LRQNASVRSAFEAVREAIDKAGDSEPAEFARTTRNAIAQAIVASAFAPLRPRPPEHEPPEADLRRLVGPELAAALTELYRGSGDWTSRAIDVLEPLHLHTRVS
jgi:hypothetical protein